ncbi:hypothetical protein ONE63_008287 [Megalurothrips usitatus]|uniref:Coiled-coil-helix-coiled-coil-helix domain-containing protein 7 n=1 Tax=Megalurothrips usitatus TaxID=439358 RepID=A0AAV7XLN6_9NEOP|nr:hypothetical protein ONE63_008287 [Megalurothrips usitatus]
MNDHQGNRSSRTPEDFPCSKEKMQSLKCLDDNQYDYNRCQIAFDNFKFCLGFWEKVKKSRRRYRIEPAMPSPEERAEIFRVFKATGSMPDYAQKI